MNPNALTIRRLASDDLASLTGVDPLLASSQRRRRVVGELIELGCSWLAEREGRPVGFVIASRRFYDYPFVDLLVVADAERRDGVGSLLMARCEEAHDADRLFTSTNQSNRPMQALLAGRGYQPSGVIENLDPGDPELVFVKFRLRR
jgi:GNAT superfamily N-acetyltransferase